MLLNSGFTFTNPKGTFQLKPTIELDPYFRGHDDPLYEKAIASVYEHGLNTISSSGDQYEQPVVLEFAGIDVTSEKQILDFCNKYGLLFSRKVVENDRNDYMFMKIPKDEFTEVVPVREADYMTLYSFQSSVIHIRYILDLRQSIESQDVAGIIRALTYFCFNPYSGYDDEVESATEAVRFNDSFCEFCDNGETDPSAPINDLIRQFLDDIEEDMVSEQTMDHYIARYFDMHHSTWQELVSLFRRLQEVIEVKSIDPFGTAVFSVDLSETDLDNIVPDKDALVLLGQAVLMDILNEDLLPIHPEMEFVEGALVPNWRIWSLYRAMILELFFRFTPYTRIKKCANPTCGHYFETSTNNNRRMYCSTSCAQLMAKRMQREREKAKSRSSGAAFSHPSHE